MSNSPMSWYVNHHASECAVTWNLCLGCLTNSLQPFDSKTIFSQSVHKMFLLLGQLMYSCSLNRDFAGYPPTGTMHRSWSPCSCSLFWVFAILAVLLHSNIFLPHLSGFPFQFKALEILLTEQYVFCIQSPPLSDQLFILKHAVLLNNLWYDPSFSVFSYTGYMHQ